MQVIATAGHVDHGKSTLVRALTGMEPDRFAEEQRRGMTLDLGFAWTELPDAGAVAFVDVPGHERFVTTMLAGVGPVPAVLFVVAADEGWMPQSQEHLDALAAIGVHRGLLVLTRADLLEPELAAAEAAEHLAGTPLAGLRPVGVSAVTGQGMDVLRGALAELVTGLPIPDPQADVRLWVDRAFTVRGAGTVVTGTLAAGRIRIDDELVLATRNDPGGARRPVTVRGLQTVGRPVPEVRGVARVAVNLRGVPREAVARGDALLTPDVWLDTDLLDVRLHRVRADPSAPDPSAPDPSAPDPSTLPEQLMLHVGSAAVPVHRRPLGADTVRLRCAHPVPLRIGDRLVLRDPGRRQVVAGATVLDVVPPPLRRRGAAAARADALAGLRIADRTGQPAGSDLPAGSDGAAGTDAVGRDVVGRDVVGSAEGELARRGVARRRDLRAMGVPVAELDALARSGVPTAAGWLLDPAHALAAAGRLAAAVAAHDAADPLAPGLPTEAARRAAGLPDARLLPAVLAAGTPGPAAELVLREGRVAQVRSAGLPDALRRGLDAVRADLSAAPFAAPEADRLAELGWGPRQLASLVKAGELVRIADGIVLLPDAADRAVAVLRELGPTFTLSQARQALGTTRRVAVPLLEHLARTGRTARTDDGGHRLV